MSRLLTGSSGSSWRRWVLDRRKGPNTAVITLPEKLRGGRIERYLDFWRAVFGDYRDAIRDVRTGARARPVRAAVLSSVLAGFAYLGSHTPDEESFRQTHIDCCQQLMTVPKSIRNPEAETHHDLVSRCQNQGLLRHQSLGIFSVVWQDNFSKELADASSQTSYLKVGYLGSLDRIIDIGFLDQWWITRKRMRDFDVNPDEWNSAGRPKRPTEQLKPMW